MVLMVLVIPLSFLTSLIGCIVVDKYNNGDSEFPIILGGLLGGIVWIIPYLLFAIPSSIYKILL